MSTAEMRPVATLDTGNATPVSGATREAPRWSPVTRVLFRFGFAYLVLYLFPSPIGQLPGTDWPAKKYGQMWDAIAVWVGARILHVGEVATATTGSGDRAADWIQLLCFLVLSFAAALVWSFADRRREAYPRLAGLLRVYLRYGLAFIMLSYGMAKVWKTQFPFPSTDRLLEAYGDSSPMGLVWTFMGYSTAYTVFCGAGEVVGGLLLLSRRTTTIGALVLVAVLSNVVMINLCYDVPVKQYSSHLLLMACVLAAPDARRLADVLFFHRPTEPPPPRARLPKRWMERARLGLKLALIAAACFSATKGHYDYWKEMSAHASPDSLEGVWAVESFRRGGEVVPPLVTDRSRWRRVTVYPKFLTVREMNDERAGFGLELDAEKKSLVLTSTTGDGKRSTLVYARPAPDHLELRGTLADADVEIGLKKLDVSQLPLVTRGFHWVSEYPFNR